MSGKNRTPRKPKGQDGFESLDYSGYGPYGEKIQDLHQKTWRLVANSWETVSQLQGYPSLEKVLHQTMDQSGFWFDCLLILSKQLKAFSYREFSRFWDEFRGIFEPDDLLPLNEVSNWQLMELRVRLIETIVRVKNLEPLAFQRWPITEISYSAFSEQQINYLLRKPVVEMGCGSGYLVAEVNHRGGDAIGIDKKRHSLTSGTFPWTRQLLQQNRLICGSTDLLQNYGNHTLLISWPPPGSSYPAEALKTFSGNYFAFKPGVFIDRLTIGRALFASVQPNNPVRQFFELLKDGWVEVKAKNRPEYNPWALGDNLWIFKRRESKHSS